MLFPYQYPRNKIQKIQSFVNYIMLEVVLRARKYAETSFSLDFIIEKYKTLIVGVNDNYLFIPIKNMFSDAKLLDSKHLKVLRAAVYQNNQIDKLCKKKQSPIRYRQLKSMFTKQYEVDMINNIKVFCRYLYDKCLETKPFRDTYGEIKKYHDELVGENIVCGFCGEMSMLTVHNSFRNAFDHYLPKSVYPFVSVNFHNLVPACANCNSTYKKSKDILYNNGHRVKAFYPFTMEQYNIHISIDLKNGFSFTMTPDDIDIHFTCMNHQEEVDNWLRVYGIVERYKSYCCSSQIRRSLILIVDHIHFKQVTFKHDCDMMEQNIDCDMNFLKIPFYKAVYESLGLPTQ